MRKKAVIIPAVVVLALLGGTAYYLNRPVSDLAVLKPQAGVRLVPIEEVLRGPIFDKNLPILGRVTWPKAVPDVAAIRNMHRRQPNMAGVLYVDGNILDMVPRLEIAGKEYPILDPASSSAHIVALPRVYGTEPRDGVLHYGDLPPIYLRLPSNGRAAPWQGDKVVEVGAFRVHFDFGDIAVPSEFAMPNLRVERADSKLMGVQVGRDHVALTGKYPVAYGIVLSEKNTLISLRPITPTKTEVTVVITSKPGVRNFKLVTPDGRAWVEAEQGGGQKWCRSIAQPDGSIIEIPGTPFGLSSPDLPQPAKGPTMEEIWKASLALKSGQKLPAIIYKPGRPIASGTVDFSFIDDHASFKQ